MKTRHYPYIGLVFIVSLTSYKPSLPDIPDIPDIPNMNIKGYVHCSEKPLAGVVVTDGYSVTTTNTQGIYYIKSHASAQFVIITMPSNYEANTINNIPEFFKRLKKDGSIERHDFSLREANNEKHVVVTPADLHLANRFNKRDIVWFNQRFVSDVNALIDSYATRGIRTYMLTLGDLSSDFHWYNDSYNLTHYVEDMKSIKAPIFNCMGNHDNDIMIHDDWGAEQPWRNIVGPVYYSFNLGKVHYVVLDNSIWINPPEKMSQIEVGVTDFQLEWLRKNLQHVDKNTPIYVAMHCQLSSLTIEGMDLQPNPYMAGWKNLFDCFDGFKDIHFVTGHSHVAYNVNYGAHGYPHIFEHNTSAVSSIWWWTTYFWGVEIGNDGAPGGYGVYEVDGTSVWRRYKGYGLPIDKTFRTYDRNQVHITADKFMPDTTGAAAKTLFESTVGEYVHASNANEILINVWGYGPGWNIEVKEEAVPLTVRRIKIRDPLKVVRYNLGCVLIEGRYPNRSAANGETDHFFAVTASSATSTVYITVTDDTGNVYTEQMYRPKPFTINSFD